MITTTTTTTTTTPHREHYDKVSNCFNSSGTRLPYRAMSEYEVAGGGRLKLKNDSGIKKKKNKNKNKEKTIEKLNKGLEQVKEHYVPPTKAELAFMKQQEKLQKEKILKIASTTHKQRVEEFNRHLDNLTEHFDIPKVSWTK